MFKSIQISLTVYGTLSFLLTANARSIIYSQIEDVKIKVTNDKWQCDRIECPIKTYRCFVAKEKDLQDPTQLQRINICYSKDNQVLNRTMIVETVDEDSMVNTQINSYRSGVINSINWFSSYGEHIANLNNDHQMWNVDLSQMTNNNTRMASMHSDLFDMTKINRNFLNLNEYQTKMNGNLTQMNGSLNQMNGNLTQMNGKLSEMNANLSKIR